MDLNKMYLEGTNLHQWCPFVPTIPKPVVLVMVQMSVHRYEIHSVSTNQQVAFLLSLPQDTDFISIVSLLSVRYFALTSKNINKNVC